MKKLGNLLLFTLITTFVFAQSFNHSKWNNILEANVSTSGKVNYEGIKAKQGDLDAYLNSLKTNPPKSSWTKNETKAYWINAYNAFTVKLILKNWGVKSIMEINNGKAWDLEFIKIDGKNYSLNHIEHQMLRAVYKDARIHFAVNCASISCPKLSNKAFTAKNLEAHLNEMAISFINNSSKNSISEHSAQVSALFDWYKEDFTKDASLIYFLNKYSKTKLSGMAKITYKEYNWNLNNK